MTSEEDKFSGASEGDLIAELLCITGELGGEMKRITTYDNTGRSSKKITIEYNVTHEKRK